MKKNTIIFSLILLVAILLFTSSKNENDYSSESSSNYTLLCQEISMDGKLPSDAAILNQNCVNVFAWETFLALNWPAKKEASGKYVDGQPADVGFSQVGQPGDLGATVWETFADISGVFRNTAPDSWADNQLAPLGPDEDCSLNRIFRAPSKTTGKQGQDIKDLFQASGPQWLTAQDGNLVWYEVLIDSIEFNFINDNKLYDPDSLWSFAIQDKLWLPDGSTELKAAWKQFSDEEWDNNTGGIKQKYKMIQACVPRTVYFEEYIDKDKKKKTRLVTQDFQPTYLGLVGLHIIVRTPSTPQLLWASFEHVDNNPTQYSSEMDKEYTFYNPNCTKRCQVNTAAKVVVPGKDSLATPNQTVREKINSIGKDAAELNKVVKEQIIAANSNSVWQYYQLINVQWPNTAVANTMNNKDGNNALEFGGTSPTVQVFGNPVAETYVQSLSCIDCHATATVKSPSGNEKWPASYSFVFDHAQKQVAD